ncbi:MAG: YufK family protein [Bacillaceae bacterium]|nr:YufK family protein [Bacillaceae bacterium]
MYSLSPLSLVGLIFFHIFFWFAFIISVLYALLKLYNSFIASLPI